MKMAAFVSKALCLALMATAVGVHECQAQQKPREPTPVAQPLPGQSTKTGAKGIFRSTVLVSKLLDEILLGQSPQENYSLVCLPDASDGLDRRLDGSIDLKGLTTIQRIEKAVQSVGLRLSIIEGDLLYISRIRVDAEALKEWMDFEAWSESQLKLPMPRMDEVLLRRLQLKKIVSDYPLLLNAFNKYSRIFLLSSPADKTEIEKISHEAKRAILPMVPLLEGRTNMRRTLSSWLACVLLMDGDERTVDTLFKQIVPDAPISTDSSQQLLLCLMQLGEAYEALPGTREHAHVFYAAVINLNAGKFKSEQSIEMYERHYIRAGSRLIALRQGDLKALQNTYFFSFAKPTLLPELEKAIQVAGGETKDIERENFYPPGIEDILRATPERLNFGSPDDMDKMQ